MRAAQAKITNGHFTGRGQSLRTSGGALGNALQQCLEHCAVACVGSRAAQRAKPTECLAKPKIRLAGCKTLASKTSLGEASPNGSKAPLLTDR